MSSTSRLTLSPAMQEVNRMAVLLMDEWERVEHEKVSASFVATFVDLARAVIIDRNDLLEELATELYSDNGPEHGSVATWLRDKKVDVVR